MKTDTIVLPEINQRRCHDCTTCVYECPQNVLTAVPVKKAFPFGRTKTKVLVINPQNCVGCNRCVASCRHRAIKLFQVSEKTAV